MKKEGLRRRLALCILENIGSHKITVPNVKRYVTPRLLSFYNIRLNTQVTDLDRKVAIEIVNNATASNPTPFRHAKKSSPWGIKRQDYFLQSPLADLM